MNQIRHNVIRGVLYGVAVGDALGAPVEFMHEDAIKAAHGRVREMIGGGWLNVRPGETTDDTAMTLCVAKGIVANSENPVEAIGEEFIRWVETRPKDIGGTCASSINAACASANTKGTPTKEDWFRAAYNTHIRFGGKSAGNGTLMRTSYVPCFYRNEVTVLNKAREISEMTHYDNQAAEACQIYCDIIYKIRNVRGIDRKYRMFRNEVRRSPYAKALEYGFKPNPTGYVKDSFEAAIWAIEQGTHSYVTNFREAVEAAVNLGGDADTIGAITGGLAGAICGANHIPKSWIEALDGNTKEEINTLAKLAENHLEAAES